MKIGIITFWQSHDNYGQQLQCWALQQYLKKNGHDAFLIRYDFDNRIVGSGIQNVIKRTVIYRIIKSKIKTYINRHNKSYHDRKFEDFRKDHITMSKRMYYSLKFIKKHLPICDVYIVGSDQVWSQLLYIKENEVFYLSFGDYPVKRIAYAPSFGRSTYPQELWAKLREKLSQFDAISVRDDASVKICETVGVSAIKVLDPTLLLTKRDYYYLLESDISINNKMYTFIYSLNVSKPDDLRYAELERYCMHNNFRCIATASSGYFPAQEMLPVKYVYPTIGQWLSYINNASFVVTPSFHGVIFCIIMHIPFVYIPLKGRFSLGNDRVFSLLKDLSLTSRILLDNVTYESILSKEIDWLSVDSNIKVMKELSINFLSNSLK